MLRVRAAALWPQWDGPVLGLVHTVSILWQNGVQQVTICLLYPFNFLMEWIIVLTINSSFFFFFYCSIFCKYIWIFWPFYVRNIFHIFRHLWIDCSIHHKTGTRDQGEGSGRNTGINDPISAIRLCWSKTLIEFYNNTCYLKRIICNW